MNQSSTASRSAAAGYVAGLAVLVLGFLVSCASVPDLPSGAGGAFQEQASGWVGLAADRGLFSGYAVVGTRDGIMWQGGFGIDGFGGKPRADHAYNIGSVTKMVTGMALLDAADRGLLSLDDTLARWFPGFPGGDAIRLTHLLEHSSGLPEISERPFFWFRLAREVKFEEHFRYISTARRKFAPGEQFSYCNSGYILLGRILELASGLPYGAFTGVVDIDGTSRRILWHSGGHGGFASMLSVYPDDGLVIVVLANVRNPARWFIGEEIEAGLARLYFRQ